MRWHTTLRILMTLGYLALVNGFLDPLRFPHRTVENNLLSEEDNLENQSPQDLEASDDEQIENIGNFLTELLILPWPNGIGPLLYVENNPAREEIPENVDNTLDIDQNISPKLAKRTRYYRKYPWKRQNSRYEPGNRFLCTPSKEDVYRLLVALHEARQGSRERMVHFCNRKRPAHAVFTNIRYLGK